MESVGFKEWSLVCDALGCGEQSIILRKGGIAERRDGFSFQHREFFLFPTFFHEQIGKVRSRARLMKPSGEITLALCARVELALKIGSLEMAEALASLHILEPEVVRERFHYKEGGLNVAFVRVFRLETPWLLADEPRFGGCRSWVKLPPPPDVASEPVLHDVTHAQRRSAFEAVLRAHAGNVAGHQPTTSKSSSGSGSFCPAPRLN